MFDNDSPADQRRLTVESFLRIKKVGEGEPKYKMNERTLRERGTEIRTEVDCRERVNRNEKQKKGD